jgi:hypothetical protein
MVKNVFSKKSWGGVGRGGSGQRVPLRGAVLENFETSAKIFFFKKSKNYFFGFFVDPKFFEGKGS